MIWPWHRVGGWSPEQAAEQLHERRTDLICQLRRRGESSGVPPVAQEEIVDDAITAVVMSPRGIANQDHLLGAFWVAVDHRCRRYREGRYLARLGSRARVDLDAALAQSDARPEFQRLMADAAKGNFDVVLVFHTSRFARNQSESRRYKQLLRERLNIQVISVGAGEKLTPLRRLRIDPPGRWRRRPGS